MKGGEGTQSNNNERGRDAEQRPELGCPWGQGCDLLAELVGGHADNGQETELLVERRQALRRDVALAPSGRALLDLINKEGK